MAREGLGRKAKNAGLLRMQAHRHDEEQAQTDANIEEEQLSRNKTSGRQHDNQEKKSSRDMRNEQKKYDDGDNDDDDDYYEELVGEEGGENDEDEDDIVDEDDEESDIDASMQPLEVVPRSETVIAVELDTEPNPSTPNPGREQARKNQRTGLTTPLKSPGKPTKTPGTKSGTKPPDRGVAAWSKGGGQEHRLKQLFGPTRGDLEPVLLTTDQWDSQLTLPSRTEGGLRHSYFVKDSEREIEIIRAREFLAGVGRRNFGASQKTKLLSEAEGEIYMVNEGPEEINMLMGPSTTPQLYALKQGTCLSTAAPFPNKKNRRGWVFNLGSRVQEAQWVPNEKGRTQYLAVAVQQRDKTARRRGKFENPKTPAFTPTKPFPASIQIWAFKSDDKGDLQWKKSPQLELVICTDWGAIRQFRWCPIAPADTVEPLEGENTVRLGLLAGIWSDGKVRILDISYEKAHSAFHQTKYIHYAKASFEVYFENSLPTCLHWLSGTTLIVSTAHGSLAYWTLTVDGAFAPSTWLTDKPYNPPPRWSMPVADTYIISVVSGYPSRSTFVSITSAGGFCMLLDLRSPWIDHCYGPRARIFGLCQAWHEHTQSFIMPDEFYFIRCNTIRRYYANILTMRLDSQIVCCATSPVHPGVLIGGSDGTVVAGNPLRRLIRHKAELWQQIWFSHEWRRPVDQLAVSIKDDTDASRQSPEKDKEDTGDSDDGASSEPTEPKPVVPPEVLEKPLTRFSEGFRVEQITLHQSNHRGGKKLAESGKFLTIYEDPSRITCLAWNPNLKYGTWAVAGMGSGLLRVEDIGV